VPLSKSIAGVGLSLRKFAPRLYAFVRDSMPVGLRSLISERMMLNSLGNRDDAKEVFTNIFKKNWWNNEESKSGWGSELKSTRSIRNELLSFVERRGISSLLDAPCGDFNWMRQLRWPSGFRYVGGDIVSDLIVENRRKYPSVEFVELDVLQDRLPQVDAWLARDLMIHFPDQAIWTVLNQFKSSSIAYLLATNYPNNMRNVDIKFGQVRHLNLCAAPFNFPDPYEVLREDDDPVTGRVIGVWRRSDLVRAQRTGSGNLDRTIGGISS
jgi:hypothetical protein